MKVKLAKASVLLVSELMIVFLSGCSTIPKARILNIDSRAVADVLWQEGSPRTEETPNDMFSSMFDEAFDEALKVDHNPRSFETKKSFWPDPETFQKNTKTTIKYDLSAGFDTYRCKDTIYFDDKISYQVILSVKCEKKSSNSPCDNCEKKVKKAE